MPVDFLQGFWPMALAVSAVARFTACTKSLLGIGWPLTSIWDGVLAYSPMALR
ncbi:MAG: hypothetical protein HZT40_05440 [Candidatus Thiothrix singaporensis]|uniref:Uncharacterized protein n=1 Tax=Candidatus Thiothrix singaporensis TaxID=2799669 RepID=A0A7L6APU5_9GAMM|nr:MAG: hypothetical protein HZT40_05440 [Candidatus Thiothrix singaporensis]